MICHAYLRQDFAPDAHVCKIAVQTDLRVEATAVAVLVLAQHQRTCLQESGFVKGAHFHGRQGWELLGGAGGHVTQQLGATGGPSCAAVALGFEA